MKMKTVFRTQDSSITLKTYEHPVPVYPGMQVVLNEKEYTVQQAVLSLDKDELAVLVRRSLPEAK